MNWNTVDVDLWAIFSGFKKSREIFSHVTGVKLGLPNHIYAHVDLPFRKSRPRGWAAAATSAFSLAGYPFPLGVISTARSVHVNETIFAW